MYKKILRLFDCFLNFGKYVLHSSDDVISRQAAYDDDAAMTTFQTFSGMEDVLWIRITSNRADSFFYRRRKEDDYSYGGGGGGN